MKKLYIKPQTEVVTNDYLCEPDAPLPDRAGVTELKTSVPVAQPTATRTISKIPSGDIIPGSKTRHILSQSLPPLTWGKGFFPFWSTME